MLLILYILFVVAVFYWHIRAVKTEKLKTGKAVVLNAVYIAAPIILYGVVFFVLIGVEEFTQKSMIGEMYARTLLIVLAGGVAIVMLTSIIFLLVALIVRKL